jgi:hypothetical protein
VITNHGVAQRAAARNKITTLDASPITERNLLKSGDNFASSSEATYPISVLKLF